MAEIDALGTHPRGAWGYRYVDTPGSIIRCSEETAREKARGDWSVEVMFCSLGDSAGWVTVETERPDGEVS